MICKNCSAEYNDSYSFCPSCGTQKQDEMVSFTVEEEEFYPEYASYEDEREYDVPEYEGDEAESVSEDAEGEKEPEEVPEIKKSGKVIAEPMSRTEKKATALIIIILCVVAAAGALLTALNIRTENLVPQQQPPKAVALTKLSAEEEVLLEKELAEMFTVLRWSFDSNESDAEMLISKVNLADSGDVYYRLGGTVLQIQTAADPAMRFADEYGEYAYYKIAAAEIEKILDRFGMASYGDVNTENCYYYDGFYYFRYIPSKKTPVVTADIVKSKKVLDGSFYAECIFAATNGVETVQSVPYYIIAEQNSQAAVDGYSFRISKADIQPLFTDSGNPTQVNAAESYTIEKKVIEGRTSNGTVYSRYTIEYPVFTGKEEGIETINNFYSGMLSSYELKTASAQKDYDNFVSMGGNVAELPFTETVVARVTFSDNDRISCVQKIATYAPELPKKQEETTTEEDSEYGYNEDGYENRFDTEIPAVEQEPVKLFERHVEAYTFDKKTGDFISKDSILGKDYIVVSEILYRIYNSYDYTAVIPEPAEEETATEPVTDEFGYPVENVEDDDYDYDYDYGYDRYYGYEEEENGYGDDVPEDEYGFGTSVYESACCFTKNGFTFWYVEDEGYIKTVTIPFEVIERLHG
ncbi:MAG: zinc ribbon domain-containing protein [Clostridia bacterium]|nr:zinc ribbon domain-containing protein [Clostridia bacterium]